MDRGNTKQEILDASLELFSVQGFEATSISQIAGAVGIRKASIPSFCSSADDSPFWRYPLVSWDLPQFIG